MKQLLLIISIFATTVNTFAQSDVYKEQFERSFATIENGGRFLYNGKTHAFSIDVISDSIKTAENANYINVGNRVLQVAIVPLLPGDLNLDKPKIAEHETLERYLTSGLNYFKNNLKVDYKNLKKEWVINNSKLWLVWSFDVLKQEEGQDVFLKTKTQLYASTICFNQVLDLNVPIFEGDNFLKAKELIYKLMITLQLFNTHFK